VNYKQKITPFYYLTPSSLVISYRHFGETCYHHVQGRTCIKTGLGWTVAFRVRSRKDDPFRQIPLLCVRFVKQYNPISCIPTWEPGQLSRYSDSLRAERSGDRISVGGEIFRTRPHRPWGPPSLLYNGYQVFSVGKAEGAWRWPPTPSSAEVKERVELHLYSPSGPSWPVIRWTLTLFLHGMQVNPLNAELNPICHLLALLGAHHILNVSRIRVKWRWLHFAMSRTDVLEEPAAY